MIKGCEGCQEEIASAIYEQDNNDLFLATTIDYEPTYPNDKGHFAMLMVNEKGRIIIR